MENKLEFDSERNILCITGNLFNNIWFQEFGKIQKAILALKNTKIIVNMVHTCFVSPTPFLSLLLTLKKVNVENECLVEIILPDENLMENKKFLNYCSKEGFMEIINSISTKTYSINHINSFNVIGNENYENILKACIFELNEYGNNIEEIVKNILDEINESNLKINKQQRLYVTITIRNILQELIDNVDKHAYEQEHKYFAVYIRMRYCNETTIRIGKENNSYEKLSVTSKPDEVYIHDGIELYFQDIGKGIIKSYHEKGKIYPNRPLREIVKDAFFKKKFKGRVNNTPVNGLAFLRKIIEEKNNFFCVYNDLEGAGNFGINDKKMNINNINMKDFREVKSASGIKGQIYNFTIFDRKYQLMEKESCDFMDDLLEVYAEPYRTLLNNVIDFRVTSDIPQFRTLQNLVLLFMPEYLTKNTIINMLKKVLDNSEGIRKLVICDVEEEELVLFEFSLKNLSLAIIDEKTFLQEIYVVTKTLKVRKFSVLNSSWKFVRNEISFRNFNKQFEYLYRLKTYESQYLGKFLETNTVGKYILTKGTIEWTNGEVIDGYINFDMMSSNDLCFELLLRNLKRILPIIGRKKLYAIDSVVERLVGEVNLFINEEETEKFGVGSIIVSGLTLQSSDYIGNTIHFFSRGTEKRLPALFFNPVYLYREKNNTPKEIYVRSGKSPRIISKGKIQLKQNGNSYLSEKEIYKILHQYAYSSILCGHLYFERKHDMLNINLEAIMYDENTKLQQYVDMIIKYGLGHYFAEDMMPDCYFDALRNVSVIVYPYNQVTASIFKMCNVDEKYRKYIIGLSPINVTNYGAGLVYSECFTKYISEIIGEFKMKYPDKEIKIIIFDSLTYSGKTKREIYEYIHSIEEVTPYYVNIIDARVNHYDKSNNAFSYMNLNIPLLGQGESCKLCYVLNKLSDFKDNIIDASILSAIVSMEKIWKVKDSRNYQEIIKLANFDRIYAKQILKYDFGVEVNEEDLYFVNALPLYIFITNRIKLENDYSPLEFVVDNFKKIIDQESMAYIMALFLFEYGNNVYHSLQKKIVMCLVAYLMNSKELLVRQFVTLSLLSLDDAKLGKIVFEFIQNNTYSMQTTNEGQIVLMYCLHKNKMEKNLERFSLLYNKMKSGNKRLDLYKQFHCQLKNTNGNIHNSPLMSLVNMPNNIENKRLTLAGLTLFEQSLKCVELTFDMLYEEGRDDFDTDKEISQVREKCLQDIAEIKEKIRMEDDTERLKGTLKNIFDAGEELHKRLFAPYIVRRLIENRNLISINNLLADRIEFYNEKIKNQEDKYPILFDQTYENEISVSQNVVTIYYIWNNMLIREIDYALDNVGKFVTEEQAVMIENQKVAGQIRIRITVAEFVISIYNNTRDTIQGIRSKAKQRYQKEVLEMLGVKFEYCENNDENENFDSKAVVTKISVPNIQNIKEHLV